MVDWQGSDKVSKFWYMHMSPMTPNPKAPVKKVSSAKSSSSSWLSGQGISTITSLATPSSLATSADESGLPGGASMKLPGAPPETRPSS